MDQIRGNRLDMIGGTATVDGNVRLVPGIIGNALNLENGQYVDLGNTTGKCLGDLEACRNGFYISFFVRFVSIKIFMNIIIIEISQ